MTLAPRQRRYLGLMGIDVWRERPPRGIRDGNSGTKTKLQEGLPAGERETAWSYLREQVETCTRCPLHNSRTRAVFGTGNEQADWMLIGEAPGAEEDRQGVPFVGRAGKLLNSMLQAIGLSREEVYIANILKSRPPDNRDPRPEEVAACEPFLHQQIELVQPKLILALGRIAAQNLLKIDTPIGRMRGNFYEHPGTGTPVVVTYHPAYLLRSPKEKRKSWQDLQSAVKLYRTLKA
jgi:DNA polymerase